MHSISRIAVTLLFLGGSGFWLRAGKAVPLNIPEKPAPSEMAADPLEPEGAAEITRKSFEIDISACEADLLAQPESDRADQLADWALYGTLLRGELKPEEIRGAIFDRLPIRSAALEETVNYEYGTGRRVVLGDSAWLFRREDDPTPRATLVRLADTVRMELGEIPKNVRVYRYRPEPSRGRIVLTCEGDSPGKELFSAASGYVEADVTDAAALAAWLERVDDVTHMEEIAGGVRLGGRWIESSRTQGATLDDVACLYQAHVAIQAGQARVESETEAALKPLNRAYSDVIDAYNAKLRQGNLANPALEKALRTLETGFLTGIKDPRAPRSDLGAMLDLFRTGRGTDVWSQSQVEDLLGRSGSGRAGGYAAARVEVDALERRMKIAASRIVLAKRAELEAAGVVTAPEPGFSLDPLWDVSGLVADLGRLRDDPAALMAAAEALADGLPHDESAKPVAVWYAEELRDTFALFGTEGSAYRVSDAWRPRIDEVLGNVRDKTGREAEEGALLSLWKWEEDLQQAAQAAEGDDSDGGDAEAARTLALLGFIQSRNRFQAARYDGPLQGTHVGMVLFYTDLLAKLWAGVDYYHRAPTEAIPTFLPLQLANAQLEAPYWDEERKYPATRLWFGIKPEGYAKTGQKGLNFAHICTRVYSAGSNDLNPGVEVSAAESSRRVFSWWDRHFEVVADYEQQYHAQNQIMKWSVITGAMAEKKRLQQLTQVPVERGSRFDQWYGAQCGQGRLKFTDPIPFLPKERWLSGNETVEILRSYTYPRIGGLGYTEGGVSLGSLKSLGREVEVSAALGKGMGRGGLNYAESAAGRLKMLDTAAAKGATFELPTLTGGAPALVKAVPSQAARLRAGTTELAKTAVETSIDASEVRVGAGPRGLGQLRASAHAGDVRMSWRPGPLTSDPLKAQRLGALFADSGEAVARRPEFLPTQRAFVVERSGSVEVVLDDGAGARVLRAASGTPDPAGSESHLFRSGLDGFAGRLAPERRVDARLLVAGEADPRAATGWQRLRSLPEETASQVPGRVERVFTDQGPPAGARLIEVDTQSPVLGKLKAHVHNEGVFLERPKDVAAQAAFDSFATRREVTSEWLNTLATSEGRVVLAPRETTAAADKLISGHVREALAELKAEAKRGRFDAALDEFTHDTIHGSIKGLDDGRLSTVAREFAGVGASASAEPGAPLVRCLALLDANQPDGAAQELVAAMRGPRPPPGMLEEMAASLRVRGSANAADWVELQRGGVFEMAPADAARVDLRLDGTRLVTSLEVDGTRLVSAGPDRDLLQIVRDPAHVYVRTDDPLLQAFDAEAMPGQSLARALKNPTVVLEALDAESAGFFRPNELRVNRPAAGTQGYTRVNFEAGSDARGATRLDLAWSAASRTGANRMYLLSSGAQTQPATMPALSAASTN